MLVVGHNQLPDYLCRLLSDGCFHIADLFSQCVFNPLLEYSELLIELVHQESQGLHRGNASSKIQIIGKI